MAWDNEKEAMVGALRSGRDLVGTLGSSILGTPIAGLHGLATLARGKGFDAAACSRASPRRCATSPR